MNNRPRLPFCFVLLLLLWRVARVHADEDTVGWLREYYREDGDRMKVDTDTANMDMGLTSNLRLNVNVVADTISGSTPTGAPPQTQWVFPTFNNYYQASYGQAYGALYGQFTNANQIYVDNNLETYQQMTNQAAQFAHAGAPTVASNNATASYHSLTNSPNYRKNTVPLTYLHDYRNAVSIGLPFTYGRQIFSPSFAWSEESDYVSRAFAFNESLYFNNKSTMLTFGWACNMDQVRDDTRTWVDKHSDDFLLGLVQIMGKNSYLTVNGTVGNETGYLADPYRGVMLISTNALQQNPNDASMYPEVRPRHRTKGIMDISWTQYIPPLHGSLESDYRYFEDTWGTFAQTVDMHWHQKIGKKLVASFGFRYYYQTAADFYAVDFTRLPDVYSADYRCSEFETFGYSLKLSYRVLRFLSLDASYMRYTMRGLDGVTSQSVYPQANVYSLGMRLWF